MKEHGKSGRIAAECGLYACAGCNDPVIKLADADLYNEGIFCAERAVFHFQNR